MIIIAIIQRTLRYCLGRSDVRPKSGSAAYLYCMQRRHGRPADLGTGQASWMGYPERASQMLFQKRCHHKVVRASNGKESVSA